MFLLNGVDRPSVKSLFTPNTRFIEVIEEGFSGGNVIPATFQGTDEDLKKVRVNVNKSTEVGRTVATDFSGALVSAGLLEIDPQTGKRLNYFEVASKLEELRAKYTSDRHTVHIIGFAKAIGDIRDGARGVIFFFGVAFVITLALMLWFVKDVKLTLVALVVAMMPVLWLLGTLPILGFGIDPLSILVPFLIFSIGVSHAVQMTKTWEREVVVGRRRPHRPRKRAFAKLFIPGTLALLTNVLGFAVIMLIPIDIVRELGITASLGVALDDRHQQDAAADPAVAPARSRATCAQKEAYQENVAHRIWHVAAHCVDCKRARLIVLVAIAGARARGSTRRTTSRWATTASACRSCAPTRATTSTTRRHREEVRDRREHAGRGGADQGRAGRVHAVRRHEHHRALRLVHAERAGHAVGDLARRAWRRW